MQKCLFSAVDLRVLFCLPLGHAPALYNMGTHYFSGRGAELDMKKAAEYFKKAADLGFGMAQVIHGIFFQLKLDAAYLYLAPAHLSGLIT